MKKLLIVFLGILVPVLSFSQVITTDPAIPIHDQPVTIIFHSDQGNKGLMNYSGDDVYAHTGVITDKSTSGSDWKYVKAAWTVNLQECKLAKVSANEYKLDISTGIRNYYGVPAEEKILQMAFVFRNADGSKTGRDAGGADIFTDVFEEGIQVSFAQPAGYFNFIENGQPVPVTINSVNADSMLLYFDNKLIVKTFESQFDTSLSVTDNSRHLLIVTARNAEQQSSDTTWFMIPGVVTEEPIPAGYEDGISYPADDSAVFVLFAPGKEHIYITGDFNDWLPDSAWQLKKYGGRFWITVGNLEPGKEYVFQYIIDGDLRVADPYSEKILDPFNDKFIPESVYPGLIKYPETKTTQIAGVIQPGKTSFNWEEDAFVTPAYEDLVIYEMLIRDFVSSHDIKDVMDSLNYLAQLGVNAIELMPFSEFEGNSSWGYNPSFYFAPDKYYGRDVDFKEFIRECHNRGIAVIMDIVLNHSYGQSPLVQMYFNSITGKPSPDNPWYNSDSPNPVYNWGYDFNHESEATKYFVSRVIKYWIKEYKIDGFRFDFTKGFTNTPGDGNFYDASRISILKSIYDTIKTVNADAYMICEHFAPNNEEKELSDYGLMLWGNSNYNFSEASMGFLNNSDFSWVSANTRGWTNPSLVGYMESHDEERLMYKNITYGNSSGDYNIKNLPTALKRMELAGVFFFSIPGPKMIWQFGELGYDVPIDFNGRLGEKPVRWEYFGNPERQHLYLIWAKLLDLRKNYPVFHTGDYALSTANNVALKKIILRHEEEDALVLGNFGLTEDDMVSGFTKTGWWYEVFTGDSLNVSDINMNIVLDAGEYRIYTSKKTHSVISGSRNEEYSEVIVYPNPVGSYLNLSMEEQVVLIEIFNSAGIRINFTVNPPVNQIDVSDLPHGYYFVRAKTRNSVRTGKFIKN